MIVVKSMLCLILVFLLHVSMEYVASVIQPISEHPVTKSPNIGVIVLLVLKAIDVKYKSIIAREILVRKMLLCASTP